MAEQEETSKKKTKAKPEAKESKTSVRTYKEGIELEGQKMTAYSKKFGSSVKSLQADIKKHSKDISAAAKNLREEGIKNMSNKIEKFKKDIQNATEHMADNIKYFTSEINKQKKDFKNYAQGPFKEYIKNFQG